MALQMARQRSLHLAQHTGASAKQPMPCRRSMALQHMLPAEAACLGSLAACHSAATQRPAAVRRGLKLKQRTVAASSSSAGQPLAAGSVNLSGLWVKDQRRSDTRGYEATLDVLGLSGLQKVTARLIEGIEVQQTSSKFSVSFVTVVPFFKVTESAPLNGGSSQAGRRDLRFGWQTLTARQLPDGVLVQISWGQPMPGSLTEQYTLLPDGALRVRADTRVGAKSATADSIYVRSGYAGRDALLDASRRRNGSLTDVIDKQKQQGLTM